MILRALSLLAVAALSTLLVIVSRDMAELHAENQNLQDENAVLALMVKDRDEHKPAYDLMRDKRNGDIYLLVDKKPVGYFKGACSNIL